MAAAALSGMEMGSGPGSEGYEDADNEKSKTVENGESTILIKWFKKACYKSASNILHILSYFILYIILVRINITYDLNTRMYRSTESLYFEFGDLSSTSSIV